VVKGHPDFTKAIDIVLQTLDDLNINIDAQTVGVKLEAEWSVHKGFQKSIRGGVTYLPGGDSATLIEYTVPAGKTLYVVSQITLAHPDTPGGTVQPGLFLLVIAGIASWNTYVTPESPTVHMAATAPIRIDAGQILRVRVTNFGTASGTFIATIHGYEVSA